MGLSLEQKQAMVSEVATKLQGAQSLIVAEYRGLNVERDDGSAHEHARTSAGWRVKIQEQPARVIDLAGTVDGAADTRAEAPSKPAAEPHVIRTTPLIFELGEPHYRRSEQSWVEAGKPRALVAISREENWLAVGVRVFTPHPVFVTADAINDMDNEHPDVNGDGVQVHLRAARGSPGSEATGTAGGTPVGHATVQSYTGGWMAVPEPLDRARVREIVGSEAGWLPEGGWQRMDDGYRLRLLFPLDRLGGGRANPLLLDVIVNETAPGRERRPSHSARRPGAARGPRSLRLTTTRGALYKTLHDARRRLRARAGPRPAGPAGGA